MTTLKYRIGYISQLMDYNIRKWNFQQQGNNGLLIISQENKI